MRDPVVVRDGNGNTTAVVIFGIIIVAALIGLFVWQPWNSSTHTSTDSNTTVTQPANPPAQPNSSTTKSTTTTTGTKPGP